jgi:thioredoxin 1
MKGAKYMHSMTRRDFLENIFNYEKSKDWKYQDDIPCVIDFHDESCPPCQALSPVLEKLESEYGASVKFYKVDIRNEEDLAQELGVVNLPTLVFCPLAGRPIVLQGAVSKEKLILTIENELLENDDSRGG